MDDYKRLKDVAFALLRPSYWVSNYKSCPKHDAVINALIDSQAEIKIVSSHSVKLGDVHLWIANYPYAYGSNIRDRDDLPYRRTRKRLREYLESKGVAHCSTF